MFWHQTGPYSIELIHPRTRSLGTVTEVVMSPEPSVWEGTVATGKHGNFRWLGLFQSQQAARLRVSSEARRVFHVEHSSKGRNCPALDRK